MTREPLRTTAAAEWLGRSWWFLFPAFSALTIRLGVERACGQPYDLLPAVASNPAWAWPLAAVYVLAHAWIAAALVSTAISAAAPIPSIAQWRASWRGESYKAPALIAALAIEYAPLEWWQWLGRIGLCG